MTEEDSPSTPPDAEDPSEQPNDGGDAPVPSSPVEELTAAHAAELRDVIAKMQAKLDEDTASLDSEVEILAAKLAAVEVARDQIQELEPDDTLVRIASRLAGEDGDDSSVEGSDGVVTVRILKPWNLTKADLKRTSEQRETLFPSKVRIRHVYARDLEAQDEALDDKGRIKPFERIRRLAAQVSNVGYDALGKMDNEDYSVVHAVVLARLGKTLASIST